VRAFNLYRSPLGDLAMREEVLRQHLPHVPFVDHSPQQLPHDEESDLSAEELLRGLPMTADNVVKEAQVHEHPAQEEMQPLFHVVAPTVVAVLTEDVRELGVQVC
jgi:hypothetical protein